MDIQQILAMCDHTNLDRKATFSDIKALIDDAQKYRCKTVCIPPSYVERARKYAGGRVKICTVIGFPNGYSTKRVKVEETKEAVHCGADEIDTVMNLCDLAEKNYSKIVDELRAIKEACDGRTLKVIVETCLLTEEEKIKVCELVTESGADFIKTSTGFSTGGATHEDIVLFKKNVGERVKIKASGGISSIEEAEKFIADGAQRLGTSRIVKEVKKLEENLKKN